MSRKDEILQRIEELKREERRTRKLKEADRDYEARGMNSEHMPLGCWLWIIGVAAAVGYLVLNFVVH